MICVYVYSSERGKVTSTLQKTISIILYNILALIDASIINSTSEEEEPELIQTQWNLEIETRMREYLTKNINLPQMI